jgi:hypothetical protein
MSLSMGKLSRTSWIATTDRTALGMSFLIVAPRENGTAIFTNIGSFSIVYSGLDPIKGGRKHQAYVDGDDVLNLLRAKISWCSEDKEIFHRHP